MYHRFFFFIRVIFRAGLSLNRSLLGWNRSRFLIFRTVFIRIFATFSWFLRLNSLNCSRFWCWSGFFIRRVFRTRFLLLRNGFGNLFYGYFLLGIFVLRAVIWISRTFFFLRNWLSSSSFWGRFFIFRTIFIWWRLSFLLVKMSR